MLLTLLYVDDRATELAAREIAFARRGSAVLAANEGFEALKLVQERTVDAVIVNHRRKGIDGGVIANAIRHIRPKVPIIMLCDFPAELPRRVVRLVDAILREEELPEVLLSTITQLIGGKSGKREYGS